MSLLTVIPTDVQVVGALSATSITTAQLNFNVLGLTGTVPVSNGGTGLATLTAHGVLLGNGTSAIGIAPTGTTGYVLIDQGAGVDPAFKLLSGDATLTGGGLLTIASLFANVQGLKLTFTTTAQVTVGIGQARDSTNATTIILNSPVTITVTTNGSAAGNDRKQISGTVATNSASATVTGTSTAFLTDFGTRSGSGAIAGAGTTITGTNTKFLSEFAVGDLIGTAAKGYSRITAIASDTSLTIVAAIPGGDPAGTAPVCIENAWFQAASQTIQRINTISSNTSLTLAANSSATQSGVNGFIGVLPASQAALMVWLAQGNSGTTCYVSTQRTTPFGITGYTTYVRRIGSIQYTGSVVVAFDQWGTGNERWYQYEVAQGSANTQILTNAANVAWTNVVASGCVPPTADVLTLTASIITGGTAGLQIYLRKRGIGDATVSRNATLAVQVVNFTLAVTVECACDGAQVIDYATSNTSAGNGLYLYVVGYHEIM